MSKGISTNNEIFDLCYEYPKMFAIRPNFYTYSINSKSITTDIKGVKKIVLSLQNILNPKL